VQRFGAELLDGDFECRTRPQRRLLEEHRDVAAGKGGCRWRLGSEATVSLHLPCNVQKALEVRAGQIEHRQVVLRREVEIPKFGTRH
jgi:hypothetical protein